MTKGERLVLDGFRSFARLLSSAKTCHPSVQTIGIPLIVFIAATYKGYESTFEHNEERRYSFLGTLPLKPYNVCNGDFHFPVTGAK
jgi:hypothetical protein